MARALRAGTAVPRTAPASRTVIVHGVARADELAFGPELAAWARATPGWAYVPAVSRPLPCA